MSLMLDIMVSIDTPVMRNVYFTVSDGSGSTDLRHRKTRGTLGMVSFTVSPFAGCTKRTALGGLFTTRNVTEPDVPPPGVALVTEKFLAPVSASAEMVIFAVKLVELLTVVEFTVMPVPTLTELTLLMKFDPVKFTLSVCPLVPDVGEMLASVGAGLFTLKV